MIDALEIETPDGVLLRGQVRVAGDCWVVLVHALGRDLDMWGTLFGELDESFSVLAADLRGHGGSDGSPAAERVEQDVAALLSHARACGADALVAVAAGDVASAVLASAARTATDAVVLLGPSGDFRDPGTVPRFVVCASEDPEQVTAAEVLQRAPGWSLVANIPTAEKGADLIEGAWASNVLAYVSSFVRDVHLHQVRGARR